MGTRCFKNLKIHSSKGLHFLNLKIDGLQFGELQSIEISKCLKFKLYKFVDRFQNQDIGNATFETFKIRKNSISSILGVSVFVQFLRTFSFPRFSVLSSSILNFLFSKSRYCLEQKLSYISVAFVAQKKIKLIRVTMWQDAFPEWLDKFTKKRNICIDIIQFDWCLSGRGNVLCNVLWTPLTINAACSR